MERIIEVSDKEVDILIYGDISCYPWYNETDNSASGFLRDFMMCESKYAKINVRINSLGGSIIEGLPIYNAIKNCKKDTVCINEGVAMSMGAIILMAGKEVVVFNNSITMFHSASSCCCGTARDFRAEADVLDVFNNSLICSISDKCKKKSKEDITNELFDYEDHFLSSDSMVENGFADRKIDGVLAIPDDVKDVTISNIAARYQDVVNAYRNAFGEQKTEKKSLWQKLQDKISKKEKVNDPNLLINTNTEMDTKKIALSLGLPEDASEEQIEAKLADNKKVLDAVEKNKTDKEAKEEADKEAKEKAENDKLKAENGIDIDVVAEKVADKLFEKMNSSDGKSFTPNDKSTLGVKVDNLSQEEKWKNEFDSQFDQVK